MENRVGYEETYITATFNTKSIAESRFARDKPRLITALECLPPSENVVYKKITFICIMYIFSLFRQICL